MRIQLISIVASLGFLVFIFELIRRSKLHAAYAILWLVTGFTFLGFAVWRRALDHLGSLVGIAYSPTALLLVMILGLFLILIQFSVVVSTQADQIRQLSQQLGLLNLQIRKLEQSQGDALD